MCAGTEPSKEEEAQAYPVRLLHKLTEKDHEKLERCVELYGTYAVLICRLPALRPVEVITQIVHDFARTTICKVPQPSVLFLSHCVLSVSPTCLFMCTGKYSRQVDSTDEDIERTREDLRARLAQLQQQQGTGRVPNACYIR